MCFDHPTRAEMLRRRGRVHNCVCEVSALGTRWMNDLGGVPQSAANSDDCMTWSVNGVVSSSIGHGGNIPFMKTRFLQLFWDNLQILTGIIPHHLKSARNFCRQNRTNREEPPKAWSSPCDCLSIHHAVVVIKNSSKEHKQRNNSLESIQPYYY